MTIKTAVGAALLGLLFGTHMAFAIENSADVAKSEPKKQFATEYGKALPPIGFVKFCARAPDECRTRGAKPAKLAMTHERWNLLARVNSYVNGKIEPVSDLDLYGEPEYWALPADAGDCEDYLLLKRRYLVGLGFPPEALLITVVLDEKNEGHAVLTITTQDGDYVLDNRRDAIQRWSELDYTFLKRQSPRDPRAWVALVKGKTPNPGFVSGGRQQ